MKYIFSILMMILAVSSSAAAICVDKNTDKIDSDPGSSTGTPMQAETLGYICEGTRWETAYLYFGDTTSLSDIRLYHNYLWIDGTEEINGRTYMKV